MNKHQPFLYQQIVFCSESKCQGQSLRYEVSSSPPHFFRFQPLKPVSLINVKFGCLVYYEQNHKKTWRLCVFLSISIMSAGRTVKVKLCGIKASKQLSLLVVMPIMRRTTQKNSQKRMLEKILEVLYLVASKQKIPIDNTPWRCFHFVLVCLTVSFNFVGINETGAGCTLFFNIQGELLRESCVCDRKPKAAYIGVQLFMSFFFGVGGDCLFLFNVQILPRCLCLCEPFPKNQ